MKEKAGNITMEDFMNATEEQKWILVSQLIADNEHLAAENEELKEIRKMMTAEKYVPSTEQIQFTFTEFELYDKFNKEPEPGIKHVAGYDRIKRKPRTVSNVPKDTPVITVDHTEGAPDVIIRDGVECYRAEDRVINQVAVIPAKVVVEKHIWPTYVPANGENRRVTGYANRTVDALSCSPSFIANIIISKFDDHCPLYRQEEIFCRNGIRVSRQNMANWVLKYYGVLHPL